MVECLVDAKAGETADNLELKLVLKVAALWVLTLGWCLGNLMADRLVNGMAAKWDTLDSMLAGLSG